MREFALQTPFGASLASAAIVALAHLVRDGIVGSDERPGLGWSNRVVIHIAQLIGTILFENDVDPVQEMGGTGTHGLMVMVAFTNHLVVVDGGDLVVGGCCSGADGFARRLRLVAGRIKPVVARFAGAGSRVSIGQPSTRAVCAGVIPASPSMA